MDDFAQNARPTPENVVESLGVLRKSARPFSAESLASRLDLLFLPFLNGLPTADQRVDRLKVALDFAATELSVEQQIVYENVFLDPKPGGIGHRFERAAKEISEKRPPDGDKVDTAGARRIEQNVLRALARTLLDPDFEEQLDEQRPLHRDTSPTFADQPVDAYEMVTYKGEMEISEADPRKATEYRKIRIRMTLPHQRILGFRYYNYRRPATPEKGGVSLVNDEQTYLGTLYDPIEGAPVGWLMHFIHLGGRKEPGEEIVVEMRERYFDEGEGERNVYIAMTARFDTLQKCELGIRLPASRRKEVKPEARIARDPLDPTRQNLWHEQLAISGDGWVRHTFTELEVGLQYGIFLPNFNLYKK